MDGLYAFLLLLVGLFGFSRLVAHFGLSLLPCSFYRYRWLLILLDLPGFLSICVLAIIVRPGSRFREVEQLNATKSQVAKKNSRPEENGHNEQASDAGVGAEAVDSLQTSGGDVDAPHPLPHLSDSPSDQSSELAREHEAVQTDGDLEEEHNNQLSSSMGSNGANDETSDGRSEQFANVNRLNASFLQMSNTLEQHAKDISKLQTDIRDGFGSIKGLHDRFQLFGQQSPPTSSQANSQNTVSPPIWVLDDSTYRSICCVVEKLRPMRLRNFLTYLRDRTSEPSQQDRIDEYNKEVHEADCLADAHLIALISKLTLPALSDGDMSTYVELYGAKPDEILQHKNNEIFIELTNIIANATMMSSIGPNDKARASLVQKTRKYQLDFLNNKGHVLSEEAMTQVSKLRDDYNKLHDRAEKNRNLNQQAKRQTPKSTPEAQEQVQRSGQGIPRSVPAFSSPNQPNPTPTSNSRPSPPPWPLSRNTNRPGSGNEFSNNETEKTQDQRTLASKKSQSPAAQSSGLKKDSKEKSSKEKSPKEKSSKEESPKEKSPGVIGKMKVAAEKVEHKMKSVVNGRSSRRSSPKDNGSGESGGEKGSPQAVGGQEQVAVLGIVPNPFGREDVQQESPESGGQ